MSEKTFILHYHCKRVPLLPRWFPGNTACVWRQGNVTWAQAHHDALDLVERGAWNVFVAEPQEDETEEVAVHHIGAAETDP